MNLLRWVGGSIRIQIILWNVCVLALILALLGVTLRYTLHASLVAGVDRELVNRSHRGSHIRPASERMMFGGPDGGGPPGPPDDGAPPRADGQPGQPNPEQAQGGQQPGGQRWRHPSDGHPPMERAMDMQKLDFFTHALTTPYDPASFARSAKGESLHSTAVVDGQEVRVYSTTVREDPPRDSNAPPGSGPQVGVLQIAQPLADVNQEVGDLTRTLLTLIPLGLIITALGGAFLANRALHPVHQITQAAERISAHDLSRRLPVTGRDEFSHLAGTFNAMLERIERAFAQQRRFTGDASHELRTPLAVIKLNTSLALRGKRSAEEYREALETVDKAADQTTGIVQDLLLLARADAGQIRADQAPTSVADAAGAAWELARGAVDHPPLVHIDIPPDLSVRARPDDLTRLLRNLLDNAVRHTPSEGSVTVAALTANRQAVISITDTGEGIAPDHLPHIFERFYRVDAARGSSRGGTGLGLAICEAIAQSFGGSLAIDSKLGVGTTVTITLPAAPASANANKIYARTPPRISS